MSATEPAVRSWWPRAAAAAAVVTALLVPARPAGAHPLGNFSVNQYHGLTFRIDEIAVVAVLNTAELPTVQDRASADDDGDGQLDDAERAAFAERGCAELAAGFEVRVDGAPVAWAVRPGGYELRPGAGGLPTAMLRCTLTAPARLDRAVTATVLNRYRAERVGWQEVTATGDRVRLLDSPLPQRSATDELRTFPDVPDPTSVLDVRTATLHLAPGATGSSAGTPDGHVPRTSNDALSAATLWAQRRLEGLAGGRLSPLIALLAVLVALLLGAGHAALPGHGKTVLAVYLAGRAGRPRDALAVGATVTATHTGGVLLVGLLLSTGTAFAGDVLLRYLGLISGLLILAVGATMVTEAVRRRAPHDHDHGHDHSGEHSHGHGHGRNHSDGHSHGAPGRTGRLRLAGIGVAGGLVPSPSALVVLLAAVGAGRPVLGVLLVLAYGLGMAATLVAAGLTLVLVGRRLARTPGRPAALARLAHCLPGGVRLLSAAVVVAVGLLLAVRAAASLA